ncbi:hypothetical protein ACGFZQ_27560 [Streptomyces sp. NPDC048254]|uniref:hypothetical protein n=1 Tax=Streptomyces sp. NPDC048254 TaxID=3365525 RepID=UPI00371D7CD1
MVTGADGRAVWEYPELFERALVITAVAVAPGGQPLVTVLEEVTDLHAVLRVWHLGPDVVAVGAGVQVHVTAMTIRQIGWHLPVNVPPAGVPDVTR